MKRLETVDSLDHFCFFKKSPGSSLVASCKHFEPSNGIGNVGLNNQSDDESLQWRIVYSWFCMNYVRKGRVGKNKFITLIYNTIRKVNECLLNNKVNCT